MTVTVTQPTINVREKLNELDKPTGIAGEAMLRAETPQEQFNLIGAGRRNILINGDFQVSQRGDYSSATAHSGNKTYYLDRWAAGNSGCSTTIQDTGRKAKMVCTSGGLGTMRLYQIVELQDINKYLGRQITLSAKVTSNSRDCRLLSYMDGWQVEAVAHSGSGQEETLSITFTVPSTALTSEASFFVGIDGVQSANVTINTGDYFEVTEVQLELGKVATPFEHRSYGDELQRCSRYAHVLKPEQAYGRYRATYSDIGTSCNTFYEFPVEMRSVPTLISNNMSSSTFQCYSETDGGFRNPTSAFTLGESSKRHVYMSCNTATATAGAVGMWRWNNNPSASMVFDAEL